jgi:integrase
MVGDLEEPISFALNRSMRTLPDGLGLPALVVVFSPGVVWCPTERSWNMSTRPKKTKNKVYGIKEIGPKLFLVRIDQVDPRTGQALDIRRRVHCDRIEDAVVEREKIRSEILRGRTEDNRVRLADYAESWLSGRLASLKPSTAARYADTMDRHILPGLGDFYLDAIDSRDVLEWFKNVSEGKAASTANGYLRILKVLMADAVAQYRLMSDPTARIRAIPERGREDLESDDPVNMLTVEEMQLFVRALRERWPQWFTMLYVEFATASRFSEVSALRWEDIDKKGGVLRIRRGNWRTIVSSAKIDRQRRTIGLTDELETLLDEWRELLVRSKHRHLDSGWVFPSRVGKPHHNSSCLTKVFKDCLGVIGVKRRFSSHGLRRTANNLIRRFASGEVARAITGHVTTRMTEHYSHIDPSEKKAAVEGMLTLIRGGVGSRSEDADGKTEETGRAQTGTSTGTCSSETGTSGDSVAPEKKKALGLPGL